MKKIRVRNLSKEPLGDNEKYPPPPPIYISRKREKSERYKYSLTETNHQPVP